MSKTEVREGLIILAPDQIIDAIAHLKNTVTAQGMAYIAAVLQHRAVQSGQDARNRDIDKILRDADRGVKFDICNETTSKFTCLTKTIDGLINPKTNQKFLNRQHALNYLTNLMIAKHFTGYLLQGDADEQKLANNQSQLSFKIKEVLTKTFTPPKDIFI